MSDAVIVPLWEWRTFGSHLGPAEALLATLAPDRTQECDEVYVLSDADAVLRIRDVHLDLRVLREVGRHGLERWEPALAVTEPLGAADVGAVLSALGRPVPAFGRDGCTIEQLLAEIAGPGGSVRAARVHEHCVRYTGEGCTVEVTDVDVDGRSGRTIGVASTDAEAVVAAVRALGLNRRVNTSYPRGLGDLLDDNPPRFATIDVGTNSVKFHIAERIRDGGWRTVVDRAEVTRLGQGLAVSGRISPEALARTSAAIDAMVQEAQRELVVEIAAVGTAGLRMAGNRDDVLAVIEADTGVPVEVISGEEESRLAYLAACAGLGRPDGDLVVFDTGGGSSQFTFGHGATVLERFSVNVGAARYTEQFGLAGAVPREVLDAALDAVAADLGRLAGRPKPGGLVGMGGAVTTMTAVLLGLQGYDPDAVQGATLGLVEVERQLELYRTRDAAGRRSIAGMQPQRAEVILAGACVVRTVLVELGLIAMTVSDRGLRHGLLNERFGTPGEAVT